MPSKPSNLIQINAWSRPLRHPRTGVCVLKTYTLYLRDGRDTARFEPAMGRSASEVVGRAHDVLAENPDCIAVEVFFGDTLIVRVERPAG